MALKFIETLKTSIYSPKHTQNTFQVFQNVPKIENPYFQKQKVQNGQRFMRTRMALSILLRATQPNYFTFLIFQDFTFVDRASF